GDSEEQYKNCAFEPCEGSGRSAQSLAREARAKGITTSVVGIGMEEEKDTPFLRELASSVGGRFYLTSDGTDLRRIFISETRVAARSNQRTQKTPVKGASDHPILTGVDTTRLPPLEGFAE